jgi:hypothetical protein
MHAQHRTLILVLGVLATLLAACGGTATSPDPTTAPATAAPTSAAPAATLDPALEGLPVAPDSARVDLTAPVFSNPTQVTNPLFPVGVLQRTILLGTVDGLPFRAETTLLPTTKTIEWNGQQVETVISQYAAYLDARLHEIALDWYAQADDGAVWYFGEDVFNYEDGVIADTNGTWLAGRDGPAGMIMPANPQVGNVYRPENIPGLVFEEVTIQQVGKTVDGPLGLVEGAITVQELHLDGAYEGKDFAPGYGEFYTGAGGDVEALALAVPTDAAGTTLPAELEAVATDALAIFDAAEAETWPAAETALDMLASSWQTYQDTGVPSLLAEQMDAALEALRVAVAEADVVAARQAALDVARAGLDLQLRYRAPAEVDLDLLDLYARQVLVDAAADEPAGVLSDVAALEWVWDRANHVVSAAQAESYRAQLDALRQAADGEDMAAAAQVAASLLDLNPIAAQ